MVYQDHDHGPVAWRMPFDVSIFVRLLGCLPLCVVFRPFDMRSRGKYLSPSLVAGHLGVSVDPVVALDG